MPKKEWERMNTGTIKRYIKRILPVDRIGHKMWQIKQAYIDIFLIESYIKKKFKAHIGYGLNLDNPKTFNEKMQWLKIYWRDPRGTTCADKYAVREYVRGRIGDRALNELYGVYDRAEDVDFDKLPRTFVLKATHGSGWNIICHDKDFLDRATALIEMKGWMSRNLYYWGEYDREWVYKDIRPRIICERYLESGSRFPVDYKIFCFNGIPRIVQVNTDRDKGLKVDFYDPEWNRLPCRLKEHLNGDLTLPRPERLADMLAASCSLAEGFPFVRVDFYVIGGRMIFGEMTFFPNAGMKAFIPEQYDRFFGNMLVLPTNKYRR